MMSQRSLNIGRILGATLLATLLLIGTAPMLGAQSPPPAPQRVPDRETTPRPPPTPAANDVPSEGKTTQNQGRAFRRQPDNLKPFAPSEEIRVDKAVDFPADI